MKNVLLNRRRIAPLLIAGGCLFAAAQGHAADQCAMTLSNPEVDLGQINRQALNHGAGGIELAPRSLSVNISCPTVSDLALFYRATSTPDNLRYLLGREGSYQLTLRNASVDGQRVELGDAASATDIPATIASSQLWRPARAIVPMRDGKVVQGQTLVAQVDIKATMPERALKVRDKTQWQENGMIELRSLGVSRPLSISASIMPVTCTPVLSNSGEVNFGKISHQDLSSNGSKALAARNIQLSIRCDAPAKIALNLIDNQDGSAAVTAEDHFGLGADDSGNRIGSYQILLDSSRAQADTLSTLFLTEQTSGSAAWSAGKSGTQALAKGQHTGFTDAAGAATGPVAMENINATLSIAPVISATRSLNLSNEIEVKGSATIEIIYL